MKKSNFFKDHYKLKRVINASGTMTALGASSAQPGIASAMAEILPEFIIMDELQEQAGRIISRLTGAEAGCVTASAAAGIVLGVAATITGSKRTKVESLPDTTRMNNQVLIQMGHLVNFGASVDQMIRLAGAETILVGTANRCLPEQVSAACDEKMAAALYVVSHHTVQSRLVSLPELISCCHEKGVPVLVDAASEYDLEIFIELGADLVFYSGHKFLGGPTSGIIAGKKNLIHSCRLHQEMGIGRAMKVGKESIVGLMAALSEWEQRPHEKIQIAEVRRALMASSLLKGLRGVSTNLSADPTGNPILRTRVNISPNESSQTASALASTLKRGDPIIQVRAHHADLGYFELDPCNLTDDDMQIVCLRIRELMNGSTEKKLTSEEFDLLTSEARDYVKKHHHFYKQSALPAVDPNAPWLYA